MKRTYCYRNEENVIDGRHHDTSGIDVEELVARIEEKLGDRKKKLQQYPDEMQDFWLGVLENIPRATKTADPVPFLISKGFFKIHTSRRSDNRHRYVAYCPKCDAYHNFTASACPKCKSELRYLNRTDDIGEQYVVPVYNDREMEDKFTIDQFVEQVVNDRDRYIAKRWLQDRLDIHVDNYIKELASECGCSKTNIVKRMHILRRQFRVFYNS